MCVPSPCASRFPQLSVRITFVPVCLVAFEINCIILSFKRVFFFQHDIFMEGFKPY